ncbi:MAG: ATP-binding domain-containing protein [Malacoplasma sp.]|nr:ATP-binding domain-containing protein [Malacoplasma sp.]
MIGGNEKNFKTVKSFLSQNNVDETDFLFIDECSNISNKQMYDILKKSNFKILVLSGDECQLESIVFGTWFNLIDLIINDESICRLDCDWRSNNNQIKKLWEKTRNIKKDEILENIVTNNFSVTTDNLQEFFKKECEDEIYLCLTYNGAFGINNINKIIQSKNKEMSVKHGIYEFKKNDPILFLDSKKYGKILHNNLKGKIVDILSDEKSDSTYFVLEVEKSLDEIETREIGVDLIEFLENNKTKIGMRISKKRNFDNDDSQETDSILPFQLSYAISIHKSQGLEYEYVKIIIGEDEIKKITHEIFYTAITRCKKNLKILWDEITSKKIINNFKNSGDFSREFKLLNLLEKEKYK